MKVSIKYPLTGKVETLVDEKRFPHGPISQEPEDILDYMEWAIEQNRNTIKNMPANSKRQQAIVELQKQIAQANKLRNDIARKKGGLVR